MTTAKKLSDTYSVTNRYFVKINYRPNSARTLTEHAFAIYHAYEKYSKTTPCVEDYTRFSSKQYESYRTFEKLMECVCGLRKTLDAAHVVKDAIDCTRKAVARFDGCRLHPTWYNDVQREELEKLVAFTLAQLEKAIDALASIFDDELDVRFL